MAAAGGADGPGDGDGDGGPLGGEDDGWADDGWAEDDGWDDDDDGSAEDEGWDDDDPDDRDPSTVVRVEVPRPPTDPAAVAALLRGGTVEVRGRMPWSSNGTFLVAVCGAEGEALAVYKPERGERPLWDFPPGLWRREVAAYRLSEHLGWGLVPCTVPRPDAPLGEGSLQLFVPFDAEAHYFTLYEDLTHHPQLRRLCAFDLLINNTDRKGGHCLLDADGRVWAIDNGLAFHEEFKLRTVIWEFAGEPIPHPLLADLDRLVVEGLPDHVAELLSAPEAEAVEGRAGMLIRSRRFPIDTTGRRYPWPLV
jgi:uncharacterized repeat protein (TIGR03843 family)